MRYLILPLLLLAIFSDVFFMWNWESISNKLYYIGEPCVYFLWIFSFWLYVKSHQQSFQDKVISLVLLSWLPFCAALIWKEYTGKGAEKNVWDLYAGFISLGIVFIQIIVWWGKNKAVDKKVNKYF